MKSLFLMFVVLISIGALAEQNASKTSNGKGSLQSELDAKKASGKAPDDIKSIMATASETLKKSGIIDKAVKKGDQMLDFTLPNARGGDLKLSEALKKGPVILTFYRGGWCPYCNLQLRAYQKRLEDFRKAGATLIAVSPESSESGDTTIDKNELKFDVLSDAGNKIARQYGLVFKLPQDLIGIYKKFGIDLEKNQNNGEWELPIPATYVIAPDGKIVYSFLNVDYVKRAEPEDIIAVLKSI